MTVNDYRLVLATMLAVLTAGYLMPTSIALVRRSKVGRCFALNLLLGWTVVAWVWALVLACRGSPEAAVPDHIEDPPAWSGKRILLMAGIVIGVILIPGRWLSVHQLEDALRAALRAYEWASRPPEQRLAPSTAHETAATDAVDASRLFGQHARCPTGVPTRRQRPDPHSFDERGSIQNALGQACSFRQAYEETNPRFMRSNMKHTTDHAVWTMRFDSVDCMTDRMVGLATGAAPIIHRHAIAQYVAGNMQGAFSDAAEFDTNNLHHHGAMEACGMCIQSTTYPSNGISIEFIRHGDSITHVVYSMARQGCGAALPAA